MTWVLKPLNSTEKGLGERQMALRETTVEVTATYIIKVVAGSANEARLKAVKMIDDGFVSPVYTDEIILDVQPITTTDEVKGK